MNDLVYNELIVTPGYEIEFAVGTTYSLDAEAYLAVALSFANLGEAADEESPASLLRGIQQANKRIAIFINRGGMLLPRRRNPLYAMLDNSVFEVADNRIGHELSNFHSKLWIITERQIDKPQSRQLKLIVLSRNLTRDSSLDIAALLTARLGVRNSAALRHKHEPLKEMLLNIVSYASKEKQKQIRKLVNDIDTAGEFELDNRYTDYDFIPIHFGENLNHDVDFENELPGERMAIVSPFIDKEEFVSIGGCKVKAPIKWMNEYRPNKRKVLITRLESLTPEIMSLFAGENREIWVPSSMMALNDVQPMNLHAKMFFSWNPQNGGIHLWLGSANATYNGFYRNSEFLLRLSLRRGREQFESFVTEFTDEKKQMFQRVTELTEIEIKRQDTTLGAHVRRYLISHNNLTAVIGKTETCYKILITAKRVRHIEGTIKIAPVQEPFNESVLNPGCCQCEITVQNATSLSEFYILSVTPDAEDVEAVKMVIKIPTIGIPADRDAIIFRSLIDTRDKFLSFVEMMITDRPQELSAVLSEMSESAAENINTNNAYRTSALYESLLRIAASNPTKLEDIKEITAMADSEIVPESFKNMVKVFGRTIKKLR